MPVQDYALTGKEQPDGIDAPIGGAMRGGVIHLHGERRTKSRGGDRLGISSRACRNQENEDRDPGR
jgi:hypothetical protein